MQIPQQDPLTDRIEEILELQRTLDQELSFLHGLRSTAGNLNKTLLPEDRLSSKNAQKFEVLSHVLAVLSEGDAFVYGGLGTKRLFEAVNQRLSTLRSRLRHYNEQRPQNARFDPGSQLLQPDATLKYSTFRSHLKRFGEEGRLHYDQQRQLWRTTAEIPATALEPVFEDSEFDFS